MTLNRPRRAALALLALPILLASCSDGDDAATTGPPSPTASTSAAAAGPSAAAGVRTVSGADALALAAQGAVVLDVRTPQEYAEGHLDVARNLSLADGFSAAVSALPRNGRYVVYCRSGNRSAQAAAIMKDLGFTDVADAGGLGSLAAAGGKVVS